MAHDSSSIGETALALASIFLSLSLMSCSTSQVEDLAQEINNPSPPRRIMVVTVLGELNDPLAIAPLIYALEDSDPSVRKCAARALGQIRQPEAAEALVVALNHRDEHVCMEAKRALSRNWPLHYATQHLHLP